MPKGQEPRKRTVNASDDPLVVRVQTRFVPRLHPHAIRLLSEVPAESVSHTIALMVQLGAMVYESMLNGQTLPLLGGGVSAPAAESPAAPPPKEVSDADKVFNPLAAFVTRELAAEAFALPRRSP